MKELKALTCPMCGLKPRIGSIGGGAWSVQCRGSGWHHVEANEGPNKNAAISMWNRRADDAGRLREALQKWLRRWPSCSRKGLCREKWEGWPFQDDCFACDQRQHLEREIASLPASPSAEPCLYEGCTAHRPAHPGGGGL